jgi:drug/metabolite transporter (DMT)-like permease
LADALTRPHVTRTRNLNSGLGIAAILLWSSTIALARSLSEQLGMLTAGAMVYGLAGALGCVVLLARGRLGETLRALSPAFVLRCGGLFVLYEGLLYLAMGLSTSRSQVLEVALVHYLWPMLTLFFSALSLRLRPGPLFWAGGVLAMCGVGLAMTQDAAVSWHSFRANLAHNTAPYLIAVAAAFSWSLYSVWSRRWSSDAHGGAVAVWMLLTGAVLGLARLLYPEAAQPRGAVLWEVGFMAFSSNLAYGFWEHAMRKGNVILVVSASYFTPLLSTVVSSLYLGVGVGLRLWIACTLVVAGAVVCNLTRAQGGR